MLTMGEEDVSELIVGFENSLGGLFSKGPGYADKGLDLGSPVPDSLAQASLLQEPDTNDYLAPLAQLPLLPVGKKDIHQFLRRVLDQMPSRQLRISRVRGKFGETTLYLVGFTNKCWSELINKF